ncbi:MFS transporter [Gordonia pseudamarae]|jgi:DHA2 family multidrug resistance protein-like MFS transporter|uniref:MFS transporter n=1 Tax=Gordonia pseudamarae TaxID=2831662 RepID=A0ABX6ICJ8_9ACTN|nr:MULTISPECIES: MFS transporter [Gordonia]MBD0022851.1 MFS transporter [Gordonia sp. (in: high G+C Gram-positive bacteria)]QHN24718.1 MFS transporter [Gordonia pseudamarae]QHN33649.1 MFS transporter [Gordonia pseudamarae]
MNETRIGYHDDGSLTAELPPWRRWLVLTVLSVALLTVVMDLTVLNVALPSISADLRPSSTAQLWMVDAYSLVLAGLLVTMSALADRVGRKLMLISGFALFGLISLLVLFANSPGAVIALRALLGVGGAMIMPATLSMLRVVFTDLRERTLAIGIWAGVSASGAAVGPIVGGFLLEHFSWHAAFLVNVPPMVIAIVAALFLMPESRVAGVGGWDLLASLLSIAGMASLVWAIKEFGKKFVADGLANPAAWAALLVSFALLGWFVQRCRTREDPLLEVRLFLNRQFSAGVLAALFSMLAMGGCLLVLAQWLQLVEGHSPLQAGFRLLPFAGGAVITSVISRWLVDLLGARRVIALGLWLPAIGLLMMWLAPDPISYPWVVAAMVLQGAGAGSLAIASAMIMGGSPPDRAGNAAAMDETAYDIGNVLGVAVLGTIAAVAFSAKVGTDVPGADESLAGALEIAHATGSPELAATAITAFNDAVGKVGLAGAVILALAGALVYLLTPSSLDLDAGH